MSAAGPQAVGASRSLGSRQSPGSDLHTCAKPTKEIFTEFQRSLRSLLRLWLRCPFFQRIALRLFGKKGNAHCIRSCACGYAVRFFNESPCGSSEKRQENTLSALLRSSNMCEKKSKISSCALFYSLSGQQGFPLLTVRHVACKYIVTVEFSGLFSEKPTLALGSFASGHCTGCLW